MRITLLSALIVAAVSNSTALADYIVGTVAFNSSRSPNSGSLNQSITISNLTSNAGLSGDFTGLPVGTTWGEFTLSAAPSVGQLINISGGDFGTFSGFVTADSSEQTFGGQYFRNMTIKGNWTPTGVGFFAGKTSSHLADLSITFTRTSASDAALNSAISFQSHGAVPVPEPATFAISGIALAGMVWMRRRKSHHSAVGCLDVTRT